MSAATAKRIVGVDIGGANLKYAAIDRTATWRPFAMWRHFDRLAQTIREDLARLGRVDSLAVTMTGELADCFLDRGEGVQHIVDATCDAATKSGINEIWFYGVDGRFRMSHDAKRHVDLVAAANWHALAMFVAQQIAPDAMLVDIGSTTTDIIPIAAGCVATTARTDFERLRDGSLVYVGCRRTPVCALLSKLRFRDHCVGVMNELFANVDDARVVLGLEPENASDTDTADGQPRTREMAANRLARMIGLDRRTVSSVDALQLANQVLDALKARVNASFVAIDRGGPIVLSGHGGDLLEVLGHRPVIRLIDRLGAEVSRCAPSLAVAVLLSAEQVGAGGRCDAW